MTSRHQPRGGEAGVAAGKHQKPTMAVGNNRRALGDIGNLVNARLVKGKPQPQISKPQLLRHGQPTAKAGVVVKKQVGVALDVGGGIRNGGVKPKQKANVKLKLPETIIEIKSDSPQETPKKKVHTLTSVLTARSNIACGITDRLKELTVHDIDASDVDDQLAVVEYVEDLYMFYKIAESSSWIQDYMGSQIEINVKMRAILVDWLIEVHKKFELMPETLFLTIYVMDHYLSIVKVLRKELQLVGVSAMLIACKYEEIWAPKISDLICISDKVYSREQILDKEKDILEKLEWNLTVPTPYMFVVRFLKAASPDKDMEHMVFFFAELCLVQYSVMTTYCPSMVAASAIYAARCTLKKSPIWDDTLSHYTGFSEPQLVGCAKLIVRLHSSAAESKLKVVHNKYSSPRLGGVALFPPATSVLFST